MSEVTHPQRAREFVADDPRLHWHDTAVWFVRKKRDQASSVIPEWEDLRSLAAQIKAHTLTRLADYLEEFERKALALGAQVHWARDAEEHNRIVHGILEKRGVKRLVKSKSMLTEECHMNPYLEARGIEVVDTDLGERIVQLRKEGPSHIVMPAIHLKKEEIGELFQIKLGTPKGLADPKALTEAARVHLREKFLAADAGLTGVNFAIAETGGFVVCTNEGNADLGTSLPKLHIASMGVEKIVPRVRDLGVFLRLLARSATGQSVTTYSSHFHGPREGAELHIVIVDHGRSAILGREEFRNSLRCIRCAACLNTCPVYRRSGGHSYGVTVPGPIGSVLAPHVHPQKHASLPFASSLCGSCTDVCPVKIDLHHQLLAWRGELSRQGRVPRMKRLSSAVGAWVLRRPWAYRMSGRIGRFLLPKLPKALLGAWGGSATCPPRPRRASASSGGHVGAREDILGSIRKAKPHAVALPGLSNLGTRYPDLPARFAQSVQENGSALFRGVAIEDALRQVPAYAAARRVASLVPGVARANVALDEVADPHDLRDLDFCVLRGELGVAENAAVWIPEFRNRAAAFLTQHLALVVEERSLVSNMHEAYERLKVGDRFGTFISGPSKTADIEQALVIGAHGARSCSVILV